MMGRGPFYTPFHSMWGGAFGASAATSNSQTNKQSAYTASTGANFGYPPTPPKDGTPENHQVNNQAEDYRHHSHHHVNGNDVTGGGHHNHHTSSPVTSQHMDLKPTSDQLMSSIGGGLSIYSGIQSGRKLPEGTHHPSGASYADASPTSAYSYYPATSELAMYGGGAYPGAARSSTSSMHSSRPKAKVRSNAGKATFYPKL